ncbi:SMI1/KNR4 family protein [Streptomyces uncialis]|uniref:SMI1/KNR4 family protein n=1 Tax=Streptomyces uncialis TaxID=1048205 RepID=UPI0038036079
METLAETTTLLGEPRFIWSDPAPWIEVEQEFGTEFPADFREIVDAYGSIVINDQLELRHPASHLLHDLGRFIRENIEFWREEDMAEYLPSRAGGGPGELLPIMTATTGEMVFLQVPDEPSSPWRVVVQEMDSPGWDLHEMTFGDWFLAYLRGEDVTVCSHNLAPDRPFYEPLP